MSTRDFEVLYPCRAKYILLPDGSERLMTIEQSNRRIFRKAGWEERGKGQNQKTKQGDETESDTAEGNEEQCDASHQVNVERSRRRALNEVTELIMCNSFNWFLTLTLSADKVDRSDYSQIERLFSRWASNQVQRKEMKYIAIPEYHADGQNIHYHMLAEGDMKMQDSGHIRKGKPVYNITSWGYGFSTAQRIDGEDNEIKIAKYCTKYMTKAATKIGGRWFYSGGKLNRPLVKYGECPEQFILNTPLKKYTTEGEWGEYTKLTFV